MSYVNRIRGVLNAALSQVEAEGWLTQAIEKKEIFLRPPKDESRGDLTTNGAMVVAAKSGRELQKVAEVFLNKFHGTDAIFSAELSSRGYINIEIAPDYLARELARILTHCDKLLPSKAVQQSDCVLPFPAGIPDLISARIKLNSECLMRIADQYGIPCKTEPWKNDGEAGFSYEAAIAKCSEDMVHMFVLAHPDVLEQEFSPLKVVDRSYDNPGFAIPYAYAQINRTIIRCLDGEDLVAVEKLAAAAKLSLYTDLCEKKLIKHISQWHSVIEHVFLTKNVEGLVGYLQRLSLLYFDLSNRFRLVSGNYLKSSDDKLARLGLITATGMVLANGLELLGFEAEAEIR